MTSVQVTAYLDTPTVGVVEHDFMLDGPVAWAVAQDNLINGIPMEPVTRENAPDLDLPFEKWEQGGVWGWRVSRGTYPTPTYTAIEIRRKPATEAMARFTKDREHHSGLGPYKARDVTKTAAIIREITWQCETTDRERLEYLLGLVTHLGANSNIGYGHVQEWSVVDGIEGGWVDRPMPETHPHLSVRAPYWHHTRKVAA